MYDVFDLPVQFKNEELSFPAQLRQAGYSHRFAVEIYGQEVYFEPDEEGNYRALVDADILSRDVTTELLKAVAQAIESVVR